MGVSIYMERDRFGQTGRNDLPQHMNPSRSGRILACPEVVEGLYREQGIGLYLPTDSIGLITIPKTNGKADPEALKNSLIQQPLFVVPLPVPKGSLVAVVDGNSRLLGVKRYRFPEVPVLVVNLEDLANVLDYPHDALRAQLLKSIIATHEKLFLQKGISLPNPIKGCQGVEDLTKMYPRF